MTSLHVELSDWLEPSRIEAQARIWPVGRNSIAHPGLASRITILLRSGCTTVQLQPTEAETRALIAALQQAIEAPCVALPEAA